MRTPLERATDWLLGLHSNIPECCVRFYCNRTRERIVRLNAQRDRVEARHPGYVMCTACWRGFRRGTLTPSVVHLCVDSNDGAICHFYLSGPDRSVGAPIKARYQRPCLTHPPRAPEKA